MIMYGKTYFRGESVEITGDVNDFVNFKFDNKVASLEIQGDCCWTLFTDQNFKGVNIKLNVGKYESATDISTIFKKASSSQASC